MWIAETAFTSEVPFPKLRIIQPEAILVSTKPPQPKSLPKGLLAGVIGGLAGVLAMAAAERIAALRSGKDAEPSGPPQSNPPDTMHWGFGVAVGAAYGAAAEYFPTTTDKHGVAFGLALQAFANEGSLPAIGLLTGSAPSVPTPSVANGITSHVVFGVTTEVVRKIVRKLL